MLLFMLCEYRFNFLLGIQSCHIKQTKKHAHVQFRDYLTDARYCVYK